MLDYNTAIQVFPTVLIAGMFGFTKREFFDAEPEADERPERRPQPELTRARPAPPSTVGHAERARCRRRPSTARSRRIAATRSCSRWSSSRCSALLGFAIGYAHRRAHVGGAIGVTAIAVAIGDARCRSASYFGGDKLVLAVVRARRRSTQDQRPQLMNVVQEMAIAANVPMPKVYIIDDTAPNAFATGRDPKHASVAITSGLLEKLDREELQGVIGHELSHVRNFDIRFSLLVGVLVGSIALLADFFLRFTFWGGGRRRASNRDSGRRRPPGRSSSSSRSSWPILAPIFARFVQLAVSRQREYLADASSVELTRNPYGLERALAKIAADQEVLEVANRATQHMYFTNPIKKFEARVDGMFSTHPPILDRINRLRQLTGEPPLKARRGRAAQRPGLRCRQLPRIRSSSSPTAQRLAGCDATAGELYVGA